MPFPAIINQTVMKEFGRRDRSHDCRLCPTLRVFASILLVAALGMEILPWGFVECAPAVPGGQSERTFCIEPLHVCDHGDSFVGVLFDLPVLLPGAPCLFPSAETLPVVQLAASFVPDEFLPSIDHPPQLRA